MSRIENPLNLSQNLAGHKSGSQSNLFSLLPYYLLNNLKRSNDLVQGVLDDPLCPQLEERGDDAPHLLLWEDALDGDPVGVVEMGDRRVLQAWEDPGDGLHLVARGVHLQPHHPLGSQGRLEQGSDGLDLLSLPRVVPRCLVDNHYRHRL